MVGYFFALLNVLRWLALLFGAVCLFFKWKFSYWKQRKVPYLEPSIPFGNMTKMFTGHREEELATKAYEMAKAMGWKYCGVYMGIVPTLLIVDLDLIKRVLTTDHDIFSGRGVYVNEVDAIGTQIFTLSGSKWKHLRNKLNPAFTSAKLKSMFQLVADCGASVEEYVEENLDRGTLDLKNLMRSYTTDVIGSCIFGLECNSFKGPDTPFKRFVTGKVFTTTTFENFKWLFVDNFPGLSRTLGLCLWNKEVADFFTRMVKDVVNYREENNYMRNDLMQTLINMKNGASKDFTSREIVAQSFIFFTAGADTTATTLIFALFEIAGHPDIQERLRKEIQDVLAKHDDRVTLESLQELKYMKQVLDETARLYSTSRLFRRQCFKDYKIPGEDVTLEKDTIVFVPVTGIHYDAEYWPDPTKFDPERFSQDNDKLNLGAFMAFGGGPKSCMGERMAWMIMKIAVISVLRRYRISVTDKFKTPAGAFDRSKIPSMAEDFFIVFNKM